MSNQEEQGQGTKAGLTALSTRLAHGQKNVGGFDNRYRAADGTYRGVRWSSTTDHARGLVYASARDVTENKKLETELRELALTDPLTGLFNRRAFDEDGSFVGIVLQLPGPP